MLEETQLEKNKIERFFSFYMGIKKLLFNVKYILKPFGVSTCTPEMTPAQRCAPSNTQQRPCYVHT